MCKCSFCERPKEMSRLMIEGPDGIFICDSCVAKCSATIRAVMNLHQDTDEQTDDFSLTPKEIVEKLDEYVIGQELAKKILAVGVYNHYKKIKLSKDEINVQKSNLLILGPTGTGKTYLLKNISNLLNVPFITVNTATLSPRGYRGGDVNDIWVRLFNKCCEGTQSSEAAIKKMEKAIVYFDEIDKLVPSGGTAQKYESKEFYGMIQDELLKILEDSEITFSIKNGLGGDREITIDSSNILFIFGGAFSGIENLIQKRLKLDTKQSIGFGGNTVISKEDKINLITQVTIEDLLEYGLKPEFVGRISSVVSLNPLTTEDLVNILTKPKNSVISQYKELFQLDGVKLEFDESALTYIANLAIEKKTGARGLKSILESSLLDLMYEIPSNKEIKSCIITEDFLKGNMSIMYGVKEEKPTIVQLA